MRDPELVICDGAMGLWKALAEVFPAARHQRCCVHKARDVMNSLPKSAQSGGTKAMQEIYNAEGRAHAEKAIEAFKKSYGAKFPKAVAKITDDREELLAFYDFPAEHWIHLRTTNPIESTFAHRAAQNQGHQGSRLPCGRRRDGVQADRVSSDQVADGQRTPLRRPRPCRRPLRQRACRPS